jgi:pimeloyl-ACP methyl ester carboxylesterase
MEVLMQPKPSLVLLCGLMCDARVWAPQREAFASTHDVLPVNFLGLSSLTAMAEKVLAMAPPTFRLAGHSMGGRVAMEVFRLAPERIERLALLDTGVHPTLESEIDGRMKLVALGYEQGMQAVAVSWLPPMVKAERRQDAAFMAPMVDMILNVSPQVLEGQQQALIKRRDAFPLLRQVKCPTLVATGRFDTWSPVAAHEEIAHEISHSRLVVFEDAGHMSMLETPQDVNPALADWLA